MERQNLLINCRISPKQKIAFDILCDNETTELLFGGGSGGGKSVLGCIWLIYCCLKYPGSRWLMGRAVLTDLKKSTLLTFFQICKEWGLKKDEDFIYKEQSSLIIFPLTGSEIYLKDLAYYPSDPEYDSLGSTDYTGAFVDEASQVTSKAKIILTGRIRYKLDEFKLIPKTLIASNPSKNFLYSEFYKPNKENSLPVYRKFIKALAIDNPFISKHHIENLKKADKPTRERLLFGNWEYDDDPSRLFEYDDLVSLFTNTSVKSEEKYLSCDVARFGEDKTVIYYWEGLAVKNIWVYSKKDTKEIEDILIKLMVEKQIKRNNVTVDEDGIGGGIVDHLKGIKGFVNNSGAIKTESSNELTFNFLNLKSQCYFKLASLIHLGSIAIYSDIDKGLKQKLIEELEQIKRKDPDKDKKLAVIGKDIMKEHLGRSPDLADALMMRMIFEIKEKRTISSVY